MILSNLLLHAPGKFKLAPQRLIVDRRGPATYATTSTTTTFELALHVPKPTKGLTRKKTSFTKMVLETSAEDSQWLFPRAALFDTPSASTSSIPLEKELYDRARGVEFLYRLGSSLQL